MLANCNWILGWFGSSIQAGEHNPLEPILEKPVSKKPVSRKAAVKKSTLRQSASTEITALETAEEAPAKKKVSVKKKTTPASKNLSTALRATAVEPNWKTAVEAAESKQAKDIRALDLRDVTTFTNTLVICSGGNSRQLQAIADEVETRLKDAGERPMSVEGYSNAEWILLDYGDCVVNIFSDKARAYYDLERLWRDGKALKA